MRLNVRAAFESLQLAADQWLFHFANAVSLSAVRPARAG